MDLAVRCWRKAVKLNHSLTHWSHCLRWWVMPFIRWLNNLIIPCWFLGFVWDQLAGRNEWLSTILWYLQYFGNGGTAVFHWAGGIFWGPMAERIQWFIFGVGILQLNYWNIDGLIDGLIVYIYIYFNPNSLDWWLHEVYTIFCLLSKHRVDSRFAPSKWGMALLCNDVSHWLGTNLESALKTVPVIIPVLIFVICVIFWCIAITLHEEYNALYLRGLLQSCDISSVVAMETHVLHSYIKPLIVAIDDESLKVFHANKW